MIFNWIMKWISRLSARNKSVLDSSYYDHFRIYQFLHNFLFLRLFRKSLRRFFAFTLIILVIFMIFILSNSPDHIFLSYFKNGKRNDILLQCHYEENSISNNHHLLLQQKSKESLKETRILLFMESQYSKLGKALMDLLDANRFLYKTEVMGKSLPSLTNLARGKYAAIVFENIERYYRMDKWNRELLDKYFIQYNVGMVGFAIATSSKYSDNLFKSLPLQMKNFKGFTNITLNPANPVLRTAKSGGVITNSILSEKLCTTFSSNHSTFAPLISAHRKNSSSSSTLNLALSDSGFYDGIRRVVFGCSLEFWLNKLLFLDALSYVSAGRLSLTLDRLIMVDIDDIFVGKQGTRMTHNDVEALVQSQKRIQKMVPGFKFNLGFSGKFFKRGSADEQLGDELILKYSSLFNWFGHMWQHLQPHKVSNTTALIEMMNKNKEFAMKKEIPTNSGYAIAPFHSGVYPVHEQLYDAWKTVWNIRATSTEEYPHLRPARLRRGFVHKSIMVMPRQTCGLYTHTHTFDMFPGGRPALERSILGGEVFQTILYNPISVFMTHQNNYANDRLASFLFLSTFQFLNCWTHLSLRSDEPIQVAEEYFKYFPAEIEPVWSNPCSDRRHLDIWSANKSCESLPQIVIVGPQKSGSTALFTFLKLHPNVKENLSSRNTFEEIQFFNAKNYYKGIDWYMNFFPISNSSKNSNHTKIFFEKSATYFDGESIPKRVYSLLPTSRIVIILVRPKIRAFSWYQHMRAHEDPVALSHSFYQVITATQKSPRALRDLRNKCLNPGLYAKHIERWLSYFPASQIVLVNGEELKLNPILVMNNLQKSLQIEPFLNYSQQLQYDKTKGFFCVVKKNSKSKCLGRSKGRVYPSMEEREMEFLAKFFEASNAALEKLMKSLRYAIPDWLRVHTNFNNL